MNPYKYTISLGIKHPTSNLKEEYAQLAAIPGVIIGRLKEVGTARKDEKGKSLSGEYLESQFGLSFVDEWKNSDAESLEEALNKFIDKIIPYKDTLQKAGNDGGKLDFFIGIMIDANSGFVFNPILLKKLSELNIELGLDIYPPDK